MNHELKALDAEYMIKVDHENNDSLIIGVTSKLLNASCWLRINDSYLSKTSVKSLLGDLKAMESNMVYKAKRDKMHNNILQE